MPANWLCVYVYLPLNYFASSNNTDICAFDIQLVYFYVVLWLLWKNKNFHGFVQSLKYLNKYKNRKRMLHGQHIY